MKNILICGASGFMGKNIANYFLKSNMYNVYGVGNSRVPDNVEKYKFFFNIDLTTQQGIDAVFAGEIKYDIVVQAAANTSGSKDILARPYLHVTDNAVMNSLILRACYDYNVDHFLFLSCGVMYNPGKAPVTEDDFSADEKMPDVYFGVGWTKIYVEKMCEFYSRLGRTKHTAIRHSNTYGPYDKYDLEKSHMFGATITKVMTATDGDEIVVWGNGSTERDLLYVDDVVNFIELAIKKQKSKYELVNVGYGNSFSVSEIVNKIIKHSGKNLKISYDLSQPSINTKLALSSKKAKKLFGWFPKINLDDGIKRTIEWYNSNVQK
ncbi:MAG: hypothetical protein CMB80_09020 [Flammeovirgaceae bacterium]|nr:hypothetical protein [Flammeovirgaceae bacterium]|tara:strand:- start:5571 stop:6536 length:966 start_codon:yes stop_codon:yes gene_type:complete